MSFKFNQLLTKCISANLKTNTIPMLLGEPGIGKSSWVEALAETLTTKCFTLACNQLADKADLTGARLVPVEKNGTTRYRQEFFPHKVIDDAILYATEHTDETPILFLDELNRTTPDVTSAALSFATLRSIGTTKLPDNLRIIIAGNDKGNVTALDEASISRYILYPVEPDAQTFLRIHPDLNDTIKSVLISHPELIFCKQCQNEFSEDIDDEETSFDQFTNDIDKMAQITTPRTIANLSAWLNEWNLDELKNLLYTQTNNNTSMLNECIKAHTGDTTFTVFVIGRLTNIITEENDTTNATQYDKKPKKYDSLLKATEVTTLITCITKLTDEERVDCLFYALSDEIDQHVIVKELAHSIVELTSEQAAKFRQLFGTRSFNATNIEHFSQTQTILSKNLNVFLDAY